MTDQDVAQGQILVQGLDQFRAGLRKIDPNFGKLMGQVNKRAADRIVVDAQAAYGDFYTVRRGRVPGTIRALAQQRAALVRIGTARVPWALGQEFGSNRYKQFAPWTGRGPSGRGSAGRFLFPTIREDLPQLREEYLGMLDEAVREAFPNG